MSYLIPNDYLRQITEVSIQQVISGNAYFQQAATLTAIKELSSYLRQKYDVDSEFTDTLPYDPAKEYKATNRVYLDASSYSDSATYSLKDLVLFGGSVYKCTTAIASPEAFNPAKWELLGSQYDIFYCRYPKPLFNINAAYRKGDEVFWKDKTYTAILDTNTYGHEAQLQYHRTDNIPPGNVFPDDPVNGRAFWGVGTDYVVPADSLLNTDYWTKGDNRHPQLMMYAIDIAVYHLYSRVAPKNIPETRVDRYNAAIAWARMTAKGDVMSDIQRVQPDRGNRIRWGSNVKQQNSY